MPTRRLKKRLDTAIDAGLLDQLNEYVREHGTTKVAVIERALREAMKPPAGQPDLSTWESRRALWERLEVEHAAIGRAIEENRAMLNLLAQ